MVADVIHLFFNEGFSWREQEQLSFLGTRGRRSVAVVTRAWRGYGELTIFGTHDREP